MLNTIDQNRIGRVVATVWSRNGQICYIRSVMFQGHDRGDCEYILRGRQQGGTVKLTAVIALNAIDPMPEFCNTCGEFKNECTCRRYEHDEELDDLLENGVHDAGWD